MKIAIIDDEENCSTLIRVHLNRLIKTSFEIRSANGVESGLQLIQTFQPDIVFLDIQMNDGTGFDILNRIESINFKIIFTTAFDNYAIRAFKYAAVHYLLKPVAYSELAESYGRAINESYTEQTEQLLETYDTGNFSEICLKTESDFHVLKLDEIEFLRAEGSYCHFFLTERKSILISKPLKEYVQLLPSEDFIRVHKSYLVNLSMIEVFNYRSSELLLQSKSKIPVSRRSKAVVLETLLKINGISVNKRG
ncbi:MAG: two-component system LytT family response regulator [Crocinitomix sp.]|jgi:two-component system LytT family response regulator